MKKIISMFIAIFVIFVTCKKEEPVNKESNVNTEVIEKNESKKENSSVEKDVNISSKFYVTVKSGLRLRKEADTKSDNIITIPFGSEVQIEDTFGTKPDTINNLNGMWLSAVYKDNKGYVFNSFEPKNPGFGGYVSYVDPKKEIYYFGICNEEFNYDIGGDSRYSSLVLFKDNTYIDIESNHGDGIHPNSYGTYDKKEGVYSFKNNQADFQLYSINGSLVDKTGYDLLSKDPKIFEKWKDSISKGIVPEKQLDVLICKEQK